MVNLIPTEVGGRINIMCKGSLTPLVCCQGGTSLCYLAKVNGENYRCEDEGSWRKRVGRVCHLAGVVIPSLALFGMGNSPGCVDPVQDCCPSNIGNHVLSHCLIVVGHCLHVSRGVSNSHAICCGVVVSKLRYSIADCLSAWCASACMWDVKLWPCLSWFLDSHSSHHCVKMKLMTLVVQLPWYLGAWPSRKFAWLFQHLVKHPLSSWFHPIFAWSDSISATFGSTGTPEGLLPSKIALILETSSCWTFGSVPIVIKYLSNSLRKSSCAIQFICCVCTSRSVPYPPPVNCKSDSSVDIWGHSNVLSCPMGGFDECFWQR